MTIKSISIIPTPNLFPFLYRRSSSNGLPNTVARDYKELSVGKFKSVINNCIINGNICLRNYYVHAY